MHKNLLFALACFYTVAIGVLSLISISEFKQVRVEGADKVVHIGFHFIFTVIWYWYFVKSNFLTSRQMKFRVVVMSFFYGILIEAMQHLLTNTRQADVYDLMANITGSLIAVGFISIIEKAFPPKKYKV